ncbi:hypothetical protein GN244_ATG04512 [Phytophthora infestans]|uniref:Uncharacterized protein n=1 Tax=Phytophthora infestans TaxID=4787 RepID=A0A833W5H1_PHYIN|nr:hypothetical protein GN244_ATG04512 [Phytophthora infestans]
MDPHKGSIFSSEDEDDEYELVPRDRVVPSSAAAHTSIGTSRFSSSDEDDSDDEVAIDEGKVDIVDDDNGDSDVVLYPVYTYTTHAYPV